MTVQKLCFVTSAPMTVDAFLEPYARAARNASLEVHVVSGGVGAMAAIWHPIEIARKPSVVSDLRGLVALTSLLKTLKPTVLHSVTPKAGLLAAHAGRLARVPVRVHTFTGQVWSTRSGPARSGLRLLDRMTAKSCTTVLADSWGQREFLVREAVIAPGEGGVLGFGSMSGTPDPQLSPSALRAERDASRREVGVAADDVLVLYLGRITREKGLLELVSAFASAARDCRHLRLHMAGPDEEGLAARLADRLSGCEDRATIHTEFVDDPGRLFAAADIFCMPSHREGFGSVVAEAAAYGVPAIVSDVYGLSDVVEPATTGLVVRRGSVVDLTEAVLELAGHPEMRRRMGLAARDRAVRLYNPMIIEREAELLYRRLLATTSDVPR